ncbi:MAG: phosphatase PAP2 family protein [bacterium]|nr:phosphatase PAP2 family protein [bacterium]
MGNIILLRSNELASFFWIFGAEYLIYLMFFTTLVLGFKGQVNDKKAFLLIILSLPIAVVLIKGIHLFYFEPRPFVTLNFTPLVNEVADASFPSRHATIAAVLAFAYILFKSKWSPVFLLIALWIGISRIYVGVHYSLDVLGGFVVAIISLALALVVKKLLQKLFSGV